MRSFIVICVVSVALIGGVVAEAEESSAAIEMGDGLLNPMVYVEAKLVQIPEKEIAEIAAKLKKPSTFRIIDSSFVPSILESKSLEVVAGGAVLTQNGQQSVVRMITDKYFPVSWNEAQSISTGIGSDSAVKDDAQNGKTKDKVTTGGKAFHCGSSPQFGDPTPLGFQLTVTPTVDVNLHTIDLAMEPKNLAKLTGGKEQFGLPDQNLIQKLLNSESARILSSMQGIGTSGSPALVRQVQEAYYPDCWTAPQANIAEIGASYTPAYPAFADARGIGDRLSFTPTVSPGNKTMTIEMRPEVTAFGGWTEYPCRDAVNFPHSQATIKMAEIKRKDVTTNVVIQNGATIPVAKMQCEFENGSLTEAKNDRIVFVLLSASLVGADGREIEDKVKPTVGP